MISTHVCFASRGAVREIAKVMGVPPSEITLITKRLPSGWETGSIAEAVRKDPRSSGLPIDQEPWRTIFSQATQLGGFPKHLGIHAGGIVISPTPLTDYLPLQRAAKETEAGHVIVTQWDMYPVEDIGLVKIDLLGNRSLAVIDDAIGAVRANTGTVIDYTRFNPIEDHATREIIRKGDTMGCFYVESPSMRSLLRKLDCDTFDGLVAASSIIRPGIASSGMMQAYVDRFHQTRRAGEHDSSWYLHPRMREALEATYGVMAYQEDVLKVAEMIAGMSPEDSDGLRKAMSKKRDFVAIERYKRQFIGGAVTHGCSPIVAEELWRQIESFSGYSFCKAHSASYALVSYQAAYLRAHHPAEFIAAVLSNYGGYYATFAYVSEAKRMGLRVLLPCVNQSEWHFTGQGATVRVGLCQLQGLQKQDGRRILDERRRGGPFAHLADFIRRIPIPPTTVDTLIRAGAFDAIADGMNRPQLMRQSACGGLLQSGTASAASRGALDFFSASPPPLVPPVKDYDWRQSLSCETEAIGFAVSAHQLTLYKDALCRLRVLKASELEHHVGKTVSLVGWQVTRKRLRTKHDEPMVFITFEDTHALYETVMFPREYRRFASLTMATGPFLVTGQIASEHGAVTVTIKDLRLLRTDSGSLITRPQPIRDPGTEWIRAA
jgi:error-prone DNA polymerase